MVIGGDGQVLLDVNHSRQAPHLSRERVITREEDEALVVRRPQRPPLRRGNHHVQPLDRHVMLLFPDRRHDRRGGFLDAAVHRRARRALDARDKAAAALRCDKPELSRQNEEEQVKVHFRRLCCSGSLAPLSHC